VLFATFLQQSCARNQRVPLSVDAAVHEALSAYDWPGNVRELRNVAEPESGVLRIAETAPVMPLRDFKAQCEKEYLESVLRRTNWNVSKAARQLDIQRTYLHEKMSALGIIRPE
jgi:DNA-binding NtrC family response regulator